MGGQSCRWTGGASCARAGRAQRKPYAVGMAEATAPTVQLLEWLAERPRSYAETVDVWRSHCPRLMVWEDALADRLVRVERSRVLLTAAGHAVAGRR